MFKISDEEGAAGNTAAMGPTKMHFERFLLTFNSTVFFFCFSLYSNLFDQDLCDPFALSKS